MQDVMSYCFKRGNSWYFRKRINKQYIKNNKDVFFKMSLKKLLGNYAYHKAILQGNLFSITNYINNNLEIYLFNKENITLKELTDFTSNLVNRYEKEAMNITNDYSNQLNTQIRYVEDMRFDALDFTDENGRVWAGHTPEALDKEIKILKDAYDSKNRPLLSQKAKDILNRQDIIKKSEMTQLQYLDLKEKMDFEEALVKKEVEILLRDKQNYIEKFDDKSSTSNIASQDALLNLLSQHPELKNVVDNIKHQNENKSDNWDYLIESFLSDYSNKPNSYRNCEVALTQFKQMMKGDKVFFVEFNKKKHYLTEKTLLNATSDDIKAIKALLLDLPKTTNTKKYPFLDKWRENGIIYTIFTAKKVGAKKNMLSGIQGKAKIIKKFIKDIQLSEDKYKDLKIGLWEKILTFSISDLSHEDLAYNDTEELTPLQSEYINNFLSNRYKDKGLRAGTAKRNFTTHTKSSPHIFWSVMLGIYTGARAEELAQLRLRDIQKKTIKNEEVYFIDFCITDHKNQSVKNLSSRRITPIHNNLIELGFFNYVNQRKKIKADYLFDLKRNKDAKRKEFQKSFNNDIKVSIKDFYPNLQNYRFSFHGLRSHFIAKYIKSFIVKDDEELEKDASLKQLIELKKIIGHTAKKIKDDITISTYFKEDLELLEAKRKVNEIDFNIDEGYEEIKNLMIQNYGEPILDLEM